LTLANTPAFIGGFFMAIPPESGSLVEPIPVLLNVDKVCLLGKCARATAYTAINSGTLQSIKRGRRRLVTGSSFQNWIAAGMPLNKEEAV
jgi:hypothetical protein